MSGVVYRIWSEWDFGYGDSVWESREAALETLRTDSNVLELLEDNGGTLDEVMADGLIGIEQVSVERKKA